MKRQFWCNVFSTSDIYLPTCLYNIIRNNDKRKLLNASDLDSFSLVVFFLALYLLLFYVRECFACVYVNDVHAWWLPRPEESVKFPRIVQMFMIYHRDAGNQTQGLYNSSKCY